MRITLLLVSPLVASAFFQAGPARRPASTCVSRRAPAALAEQSRPAPWRLWMSEEAEAPAAAEEAPAAEGEGKKGGGRKKRTALADLAVGTELQGKVKGIKDFGIFVDIGAESDGLVHISQMSASFVSNPNDIAKVGDSVAVRVLSVDGDKRQVALTMKTAEESAAAAERPKGGRGKKAPRARAERDDDDEEEAGDEGEDLLKDAPAGDKDVSAFANFDPKKLLNGRVASVQAYGAFIRLDDADIDGLLPTGDMDGKLEAGQRVQVRITDVDTERNRITLSNLPLLRGKRTRFALNKEDTDELQLIASRAGLYASEMPETFEGADDDADWEEAFSFKGFGEGGEGADGVVAAVAEDEPEALFGEEPEEDDEEFAMGSINVFRSPAWKRERGLLAEDEAEADEGFKYGGEAYFPEDDDDEDGAAVGEAFSSHYETQIPQLAEDELKALIKKAQGTRRNVEEEWAEEEAEEKEYMTLNFAQSKKQGMGLMMKAAQAASAEDALKKTRMPIYFSKKLSPVKQVELLEELEKLVQDDPLALTK